MSDPKRPATAEAELEARRRQTLAELESLHGTRAIGAEEYRRRAEVARRAEDEAELESVRPGVDETRPAVPAAAPRPAAPAVPATPRVAPEDETQLVWAFLGGAARKGPWEPPEILNVVSVLGGVDLDFRAAALLEGVTEVKVLAFLGGTTIIVPDDVDVEVNGVAIMGGFDHVSQHLPGEGRPLIRISGLALLGGVEVKVKPVQEESTLDRIARRVRDLV